MGDKNTQQICVNCGRLLFKHKGVWVCLQCNPKAIDTTAIFVEDIASDDYLFIECPGATLYDPETGEAVEGVRWLDTDDPSKGYEIVGRPIYAPNHNHRRRIKKEALGKIRRCRACQDYTIRMRRKEGRDFFIPSSKYPRRKTLKPMLHVTSEPR